MLPKIAPPELLLRSNMDFHPPFPLSSGSFSYFILLPQRSKENLYDVLHYTPCYCHMEEDFCASKSLYRQCRLISCYFNIFIQFRNMDGASSREGWTEVSQRIELEDYRTSFSAYILSDKRIWLLAWAQASVHFSVAFFWILWAPTLVADGREVHLGFIYPCLLGSRILGSSLFPWLMIGTSSLRTEDCLLYCFAISGLVMSIVAFDYQELGVLVMLFSIFHACVGLILPSLAKLRTIYVPNKLRGGMISLSLAPANAAILFFLLQGGYYRRIENSVILAFAAIGLFTSAGSVYALKRWGKHPYQTWQKQ